MNYNHWLFLRNFRLLGQVQLDTDVEYEFSERKMAVFTPIPINTQIVLKNCFEYVQKHLNLPYYAYPFCFRDIKLLCELASNLYLIMMIFPSSNHFFYGCGPSRGGNATHFPWMLQIFLHFFVFGVLFLDWKSSQSRNRFHHLSHHWARYHFCKVVKLFIFNPFPICCWLFFPGWG